MEVHCVCESMERSWLEKTGVCCHAVVSKCMGEAVAFDWDEHSRSNPAYNSACVWTSNVNGLLVVSFRGCSLG